MQIQTFFAFIFSLSYKKQLKMINYCVDENSHFPCTLDTASSVSVFPNIYGLSHNSPVSLYNSTTNSSIRILGTIIRQIKIGPNSYTWTFLTANIHQIILGSDFIEKFFP